jgi:hypothetical protein
MAQSAPRPVDFYKVRVMWAGWTERQRNTLREEIEIAKDMVKGKAAQPEKKLGYFLCALRMHRTPACLLWIATHSSPAVSAR